MVLLLKGAEAGRMMRALLVFDAFRRMQMETASEFERGSCIDVSPFFLQYQEKHVCKERSPLRLFVI